MSGNGTAEIWHPTDEGHFCHNWMCSLHNIRGAPEDFVGPITVDIGNGDEEKRRGIAADPKNNDKCWWLCETCLNAAGIATGKVDPRDKPIKPEIIRQALAPGGFRPS